MSYNEHLHRFQHEIAGQIDLAFFPNSAALQYLIGVPRNIPNCGAWFARTKNKNTVWVCNLTGYCRSKPGGTMQDPA